MVNIQGFLREEIFEKLVKSLSSKIHHINTKKTSRIISFKSDFQKEIYLARAIELLIWLDASVTY